MTIENALASVAVKDLNTTIQWYEKVCGRPADFRPMPEVAEWHFKRGGGLQVYQLAERAGFGSCTLTVGDIGAQAAYLDSVGISTGEINANEKVKTLMFKDPDGNSIAFAEASDPNMAR